MSILLQPEESEVKVMDAGSVEADTEAVVEPGPSKEGTDLMSYLFCKVFVCIIDYNALKSM